MNYADRSDWIEFLKLYSALVIASLIHFMPMLYTQPVITCSKLTIETLEQGVKYVQS